MSKITWRQFNELVIAEAQFHVISDFEDHKDELAEASWNQFFDTGGPTVLSRPTPANTLYFGRIFRGFTELFASRQTLDDIVIYLNSYPYNRNPNLTKPRNLRYHIENFYGEMYVLKERLIAYPKAIERCFKGDPLQRNIYSALKPIYSIVNKSLKDVVKTRGKHVHTFRFHHKDLDRLEMMELLVKYGDKDQMVFSVSKYYEETYKMIRRNWRRKVISNNKTLDVLLDYYANEIGSVLFDGETGKLHYPQAVRNT